MRRFTKVSAVAAASSLFFGAMTMVQAASEVMFTNPFDTGVIDIELDEYQLDENGKMIAWQNNPIVLPGSVVSKIPRISNVGYDCWIRVKMTPSDPDLNLTYDYTKGWIFADDGYIYYRNILKHGDEVDLFHNVTFPLDMDQEQYQDASLSLKIDVDAIQSKNFIPDFSKSKPWGDVTIQECIREAPYTINELDVPDPLNFELQYDEGAKELIKNHDDLFSNIPTLFPGDKYKDELTLKNNGKTARKLYFRTLNIEDDLLSKLRLNIWLEKNGTRQQIYSGDFASKKLDDRILLTVLQPGETGKLIYDIYVPEELDNAYTLLNDKIRWLFSTEEIKEETPENGNKKTDETKKSGDAMTARNVNTGLGISLDFWIYLGGFAISAGALKKSLENSGEADSHE